MKHQSLQFDMSNAEDRASLEKVLRLQHGRVAHKSIDACVFTFYQNFSFLLTPESIVTYWVISIFRSIKITEILLHNEIINVVFSTKNDKIRIV